jgi:hypothetical protein
MHYGIAKGLWRLSIGRTMVEGYLGSERMNETKYCGQEKLVPDLKLFIFSINEPSFLQ